VVWLALHARVCVRMSAVAKQRKATPAELAEAVEMFRTLMANPSVTPLLNSEQAAVCIERSVGALSSIVVVHATPAASVQAAMSVFTRFFLAALDLLVAHPDFDKRWLSSLRVIILAAKRDQDEGGSSSLFEVMSEMLKNTLQLLVSAKVIRLLPLPPDADPAPVWWKMTWESVSLFCPGLVDEIREAIHPHHNVAVLETESEPKMETQVESDAVIAPVPVPEESRELQPQEAEI
jgi:hypothetical protein